MALACNLFSCASAQPRSAITASTNGRHRQPRTNLSLPMCARSEQIKGRLLTWTIRECLETEAKKKLTEQSRRRRKVSCNNADVAASGEGVPGAEKASVGDGKEEAVPGFDLSRLEAYTERFRGEVLCVNALLDKEEEEEEEEEGEEEDQVIVFKGFASSLTRATPDDPSEPALPPTAVIQSIDRIRAPYNPSNPRYIEQGISWQEFHHFMEVQGL